MHHYREDDGKSPLHLLCSNKSFIQNHDPTDVASIITMIRHGDMSEGDPAEAKDRSQRIPKVSIATHSWFQLCVRCWIELRN